MTDDAHPEWYEEARGDILETLREEDPVAVPEASPRRWSPVAVLVLLLGGAQLVAAVAALHPTPHTGGDNAGYLALAHGLVERLSYRELWDPATPAHTKYPPVFPAVLGAGIVAGLESWWAFKALSAAATAAATGLVFLWARRARGIVLGVAVAALFGLSDAVLWSSRWILSDPLFVVLTFAALWALAEAGEAEESGGGRVGPWVAAGVGAAILAYFTRSAGLPLVAALVAWLAVRRRWRWAAAATAAFVVPAGLWWLRARGIVGPGYLSEFWMRNPYHPERGTIGLGDLPGRAWENLGFYAAEAVPQGLTGLQGRIIVLFGAVVATLAVAGWVRRAFRRPSVAELFFPFYWGVILLWPPVWSGDRLALPVLPLVLFYAGEAWVDGLRALVGRRTAVAAAAATVLVAGSASGYAWRTSVGTAATCREWSRLEGVFACRGSRVREFVRAARWSGERLPEGAAVFSRKPRLFYVVSRHRSRVFPLDADPATFFAAADGAGVRYVVVDYIDDLAKRYLFPILESRTGAFCFLSSFGEAEEPTFVFGIRRPGERAREGAARDEGDGIVLELEPCGEGWVREEAQPLPSPTSGVVPLLSEP